MISESDSSLCTPDQLLDEADAFGSKYRELMDEYETFERRLVGDCKTLCASQEQIKNTILRENGYTVVPMQVLLLECEVKEKAGDLQHLLREAIQYMK
jgi:hypothetical protein